MSQTDTAELAAAKNLLARIHRDGGHHTEAVGFARSVADADGKVLECLLAAEERTAIAAHVERLVGLLKIVPHSYFCRMQMDRDAWRKIYGDEPQQCNCLRAEIQCALTATPAQSFAAHDAALLRALADRVVAYDPKGFDYCVCASAKEILLAEADRIAKEAANG